MGKKARSKGAPAQGAGSTSEPQAIAADLAQTAKDKTVGIVEQQKAAAAEQVEDIARVLDGVAESAPAGAPYLRHAATSIRRVSTSLRDRSVDEILRDFGRFAGRRPAAVIGVTLIGGFALARFLKSSADRHASGRQRFDDVQTRQSARSNAGMPAPSPGRTASPDASPVAGGLNEGGLSEVPSPAAGMGSMPDTASGTTGKTIGTSSAGGAAEAPDQGAV
ncbi:MAG TPA: hypothetical protein VEZ16_02685 [Microvirga sp.]|nr:hypothetical protein [Microvirga sp.]